MAYRPTMIAAALGAILGLLLTLAATSSNSYEASYSLVWAALLAALLLLIALFFLVPRKTRWLAVPLAIAAVLLMLSWWVSMAAAVRCGVWDEPMVEIGPRVPARLIVVVPKDVSESDINAFIDAVLSRPHPNKGMSLRSPISSLVRVSVDQHPALALQLRDDPGTPEQLALERSLEGHESVLALLHDVAPAEATLGSP